MAIYGHALNRPNRDPEELNESSKKILDVIGWWYNAVPLEWEGETYQVGRTIPPDIEYLVRGWYDVSAREWEKTYKYLYKNLATQNWLHRETIFRKQIGWAPGRDARKFLDDWIPKERGLFYKVPDHTHFAGGLVGDFNESLLHRAGVELAYHAFANVWGYKRVYTYPNAGSRKEWDLYAEHPDQNFLVEVLTWHHDYDAYVQKYAHAAAVDESVLFIFQDRELANKCLNWWIAEDRYDFELVNFPLKNPEQRAMSATKEYFKRTVKREDLPQPAFNDIRTIMDIYKQIFES